MIYYDTGWRVIFRSKGSVVPRASKAALPCALIAAAVRWGVNEGHLPFMSTSDSIMTQSQAWAGFSVLVGFLVIFRTSQAYNRFWDGCNAAHRMGADWMDAASVLIAFTSSSKAPADQVLHFRLLVVRLFSLMHSSAFLQLEEWNKTWGRRSVVKAEEFSLLGPLGIDHDSLAALHDCEDRVTLMFHWLQIIIIRNVEDGVINVAPPILSRAHQELSNGLIAFHECLKISSTPFPFPYSQNCGLLLILHWCLVPFVVSSWVTNPLWAFFFAAMQVFMLWSLNYIAAEIENPFGTDDNDLDGHFMQEEMNRHLMLLMSDASMRAPTLLPAASSSPETLLTGKMSMSETWTAIAELRRANAAALDSKIDVAIDGGARSCHSGQEGQPPLGVCQRMHSGVGEPRLSGSVSEPGLAQRPEDGERGAGTNGVGQIPQVELAILPGRDGERGRVQGEPEFITGGNGQWESLPDMARLDAAPKTCAQQPASQSCPDLRTNSGLKIEDVAVSTGEEAHGGQARQAAFSDVGSMRPAGKAFHFDHSRYLSRCSTSPPANSRSRSRGSGSTPS